MTMTNNMPSIVTLLILLTVLVSTISAFHSHSRSTTTAALVVQRLLPHKQRAPILFAADDGSDIISASSGEGNGGEGATTKTSYGALSGESTRKVVKKCPDCDLCDGSGRILGGIGTVLEWWPIKAYRPCPNLVARGGSYDRAGQGLDEIAFGRDSTFQSGE